MIKKYYQPQKASVLDLMMFLLSLLDLVLALASPFAIVLLGWLLFSLLSRHCLTLAFTTSGWMMLPVLLTTDLATEPVSVGSRKGLKLVLWSLRLVITSSSSASASSSAFSVT